MNALLILMLVWLGSGVVMLMALLTISIRGAPAPGSATRQPKREERPSSEAIENERKAA